MQNGNSNVTQLVAAIVISSDEGKEDGEDIDATFRRYDQAIVVEITDYITTVVVLARLWFYMMLRHVFNQGTLIGCL